jgi:hypothetical protein
LLDLRADKVFFTTYICFMVNLFQATSVISHMESHWST